MTGRNDADVAADSIEARLQAANELAAQAVGDINDRMVEAHTAADDERQVLYQEIVDIARDVQNAYQEACDSLDEGPARAVVYSFAAYWSMRADGAAIQMALAKDRSMTVGKPLDPQALAAFSAFGPSGSGARTEAPRQMAGGVESAGRKVARVSSSPHPTAAGVADLSAGQPAKAVAADAPDVAMSRSGAASAGVLQGGVLPKASSSASTQPLAARLQKISQAAKRQGTADVNTQAESRSGRADGDVALGDERRDP